MSSPRNRTRPRLGFRSPVIILTVVLFPEPFGPRHPRLCPPSSENPPFCSSPERTLPVLLSRFCSSPVHVPFTSVPGFASIQHAEAAMNRAIISLFLIAPPAIARPGRPYVDIYSNTHFHALQ